MTDYLTRTARNRATSTANRAMRERLPAQYVLLRDAYLVEFRNPNSPAYRGDLTPAAQHTLASHRAHADLRDAWPEHWARLYVPAVKAHLRDLYARVDGRA